MDFLLDGAGYGDVATRLMNSNFDIGALRPYIGKDGRPYITANRGGKAVALHAPTANATLRKNEWIELDDAVQGIVKNRLNVFSDLRSANSYTVPNGLAKTVLETQRVSDITAAVVSMDGLKDSESDRVDFDLVGLPLPIVHKQFSISLRQLMTSRNGGAPLDTIQAELAARRCSEQVETMCIGSTASNYSYGGYTSMGLTNHTYTQTSATGVTAPTAGGWVPATLVNEVLAMRQESIDLNYFGPWNIYFATSWSQYLDDDYSAAKGDNTLRERIGRIDGIGKVSVSDNMTGTDAVLLVQTTSDVARAVIGQDFTTLQWESKGGLEVHFMIMGVLMTQVRADQNNNTGIVYYTSA